MSGRAILISKMTVDSQQTRIMSSEERPGSAIAPGVVLRQRYRLDSEIGRGGMGIVYRAMDLELMREVAVKVLPDTSSSPDARQRLIREARAAAALNHPHIISVHDVGEFNGTPFFVMELVHGPSLAQARPVEFSRIVDIAAQICDALEHAHANSIVHRDLKPENVLLSAASQSGSVKLADLGLALPAYAARISHAGLIVGTAAYMAPEQALGHEVDGRADLYALGVLLYELTTGRVPFKGDDPLAVVSQHVHASVVPPRVLRSDLPRALEAVILRLLAKDPSQRFASAGETSVALRDSLRVPEPTDEGSAGTVAILDALSRGHLVGRAAELAEARDLWRRARESHGHAVLLSGEPGAGKTRLAREITIQAAVDGAVVLSGGCYEYEATTPYLPFVEAFRRWVREQKDDAVLRETLGESAIQIAKLAPEIETRLGPFPGRPELPAHEERLLFFDAVVDVFANLARKQGLLFYADDLHWADRGTLWLLGHLLRKLREERVLVLGAYRETELDRAHPLAKALVDWNRERLVTRIPLRRFDQAETSEQLGALLGESVSAEFGDAVHRETEGNPFFVEEVLKSLIEKGSVRRESGRWKRCDVSELVIPQSMKEAIGSRLDRVSKDCNEVLRTAAVLGKTFTFEELIATAADQSEDALLDALDEAVGAQLVSADRSESFTFTHDKIREVLYEELNPIRRRRLHRHAAEGLERRCAISHCAVEKLAHHYIQAGDYERGLEFAKQAAVEAERVFAFDEAIAAYGRARDCAEALGLVEEQLAQEEAIGKAYLLHGEMITAGEHFERALALTSDPQVRARLQCEAAASLVATGNQRGIEYLREALTVLDPNTNPLETANAIAMEGRFHHLAGRHGKALELLHRAFDLLASLAAAENVSSLAASTISMVYAFLAGGYQHSGLFDEADRWARQAIDFGTAHNVLLAQASGHEFLGENAVHKGEFEAGLKYSDRESEIAEKMHSRERRSWTHFVAAMCASGVGDVERSEREFIEGIKLAESVGELRVGSLLKGNFAVLQADKATGNIGIRSSPEDRTEGSKGGPTTSPTNFSLSSSTRASTSISEPVLTGSTSIPPASGEVAEALSSGRALDTIPRSNRSDQKLLDEALQMALDNFQAGETIGLLYSRFEGHRCLAYVHFRRDELEEAERLCANAQELVSNTESRVSRLWLAPLYLEVLLAGIKRASVAAQLAESAGHSDEAAEQEARATEKRTKAAELLARYQELVAECQSPRFKSEATRLAELLNAE
jgi:tetratricopeptide (TPR) repeat protein